MSISITNARLMISQRIKERWKETTPRSIAVLMRGRPVRSTASRCNHKKPDHRRSIPTTLAHC
jgi:hypothetical protein